MPVNLDELFIEVADDTMPSLLIGSATTGEHARIGIRYSYRFVCFSMASGMIGVSSFSCDTLRVGFPIVSNTIGVDHEDFLGKASRRGWSAGVDGS